MRIDELTIKNFNGFEHRTFSFNPRFNLLVGDNARARLLCLTHLRFRSAVGFSAFVDTRRVRVSSPMRFASPRTPISIATLLKSSFPRGSKARALLWDSASVGPGSCSAKAAEPRLL